MASAPPFVEQLQVETHSNENSTERSQISCVPKTEKSLYSFWFTFVVVFLLAGGSYGIVKWYAYFNAQNSETLSGIEFRLPESVQPLHYQLELIPSLDPSTNFSLDGRVWIDVKCMEDTDRITLHAKNITIRESSVTVFQVSIAELGVKGVLGNPQEFHIKSHTYCELREFYTFGFSPKLDKNYFYRIYIEYTGKLHDDMKGLYRGSYVDKLSNQTRYLDFRVKIIKSAGFPFYTDYIQC